MEGSEHMPYRSNIPCKHPGCAALIPHGQMYCAEHKQLHKNDRVYASERGYGAKWQRERRKFLDSEHERRLPDPEKSVFLPGTRRCGFI